MNTHDDEKQISEINVTPFIDVMLVLLIIFMIVTPLTTSSIHVNLPTSSHDIKKDKQKPIILYIKNVDEVYINDDKINLADIKIKIDQKTRNNKNTTIFFHVDKSITYDKLMEVIETITVAGYTKIALTTKKKNS